MATIKTPAQLTAGNASDTSVVHSSQNDNTDVSRKHTERDISRLQSSILPYVQKTYEVGDLVKEGNITYRCIIAITIPEVFTISKWEKIGAALGFFARSYSTTNMDDGDFASLMAGPQVPAGNFINRCIGMPVDCNLDKYSVWINANNLTEEATFSMAVGDEFGSFIETLSGITIPIGQTGFFTNPNAIDFIEAGQTVCWTFSSNGATVNLLNASCRISEPL